MRAWRFVLPAVGDGLPPLGSSLPAADLTGIGHQAVRVSQTAT